MHWAAYTGHHGLCRYLARRGAPVSLQDAEGMTPLHWAVDKSQINVVHTLIELNADVTVRDATERTPLDLAKSLGHSHHAVVMLLQPNALADEAERKRRAELFWCVALASAEFLALVWTKLAFAVLPLVFAAAALAYGVYGNVRWIPPFPSIEREQSNTLIVIFWTGYAITLYTFFFEMRVRHLLVFSALLLTRSLRLARIDRQRWSLLDF